MADARFFDRKGPFTLGQLAAMLDAQLAEGADAAQMVNDVGALDSAGPDALSFYQSQKYETDLKNSAAGACLMRAREADKAPTGMALLFVENPHKAYAHAVQAFYPEAVAQPGVSPAAHIDETAVLGEGVAIAPGVVIGPGVSIGSGTSIGANTVIERNCQIGKNCTIAPLVTIAYALIGDRVTLHTGARLGQAGFGFAIDLQGHVALPQLGRVIVQDGANIGANTCIDRGAGQDTVIGEGTFIDNQVQIGHGCVLGRHCVLSGQAAMAGSARLEDYAVLAGGAGVGDHVTIGSGAQIGGRSGVMRDVEPGARMLGYPAIPAREFFKQVALLRKLSQSGKKK